MGIDLARANTTEEKAQLHDSEYISEDASECPDIQWNIIGTYTGRAIDSEKFIRPAQDCTRLKEKDDDYLLQLEMCKQKRKGWLKI